MFADPYVPDIEALRGVETDRVIVDGAPLHYLRAGDGGPPVLLLHGGIIDAAHISWAPQLSRLTDVAEVYVPNLPGYGPNPVPDRPLTLPDHAQAVGKFLDALDLEGVLVAGISMGGGAAIGLAMEQPDTVRELIALDAMGLGTTLSSGRLTLFLARLQVANHLSVRLMRHSRRYVELGLSALVHADYEIPRQLVDLVAEEAKRPHAGEAFRRLRDGEITDTGYHTDYSHRLTDLAVPATFVHGDADTVFPADWSKRAASRVPDGELLLLEDCGHLGTWERPEEIVKLIADRC